MSAIAPSTAEPGAILSDDELRLLAEIGFMACNIRNAPKARAIFEGLNELRPGHPSVIVGFAVVHMAKRQWEDAVRVLRAGQQANQQDEDLAMMLGIALLEAKRVDEGHKVLKTLAAAPGPSTPARRVARAMTQPRSTSEMLPSSSPRVESRHRI
jgi:predicted Zn-dependent protease